MILDEEKFKNYQCSQYKSEYDSEEERNGIVTLSLGELKEHIDKIIKTAELNHKSIYDIPMFINSNNEMYCIEGTSTSWGNLGIIGGITTEFVGQYNQRVHYVAPDERPEEGEYWTSRGIGYDLSGFVKSKPAGERLLRMVKCVLENDEPKSWLDYREHEPDWIQFKFQKEEFELEKLDDLARKNNDIITIDILKQCVKEIEELTE